VRANRVGEILRKMFNLAIRWRIRADNPAAGFARNAEAPRDRYLSTEEIGRLCAALDANPNQRAADAVRLILLTGARRGEVLGARWDQFDLDAAVWIKPAATTKQRRLHRAPTALLRPIRLRVPEDCEWVFPRHARQTASGHQAVLERCPGEGRTARSPHPRSSPHVRVVARLGAA
jgi:integrase